MSRIVQIACIAAFAIAGSACGEDRSTTTTGGAADTQTNVRAPLADPNGDGRITKAEASSNQRLSREFDTLDTNDDGELSMAEYAAFERIGSPDEYGDETDTGDEAANPDMPNTTDDSTPGNEDRLGPNR